MIVIMSIDFIEQFINMAVGRRTLTQGNYLFHQGDTVLSVFVVIKGQIKLIRYSQEGTSLVLQRATTHSLLAEASVYAGTYHCNAVSTAPTIVCHWSKSAFLKYLQKDQTFFDSWAAHLASEVQSARYRSELLSRKTVAERLNGWLAWQDNLLPAKGQWKNIATEIGVSPEALYRELAKRRPE